MGTVIAKILVNSIYVLYFVLSSFLAYNNEYEWKTQTRPSHSDSDRNGDTNNHSNSEYCNIEALAER